MDRDSLDFENVENGVSVLKCVNGTWHYIGTIVDKTIEDIENMTDGELEREFKYNGIIDY